MLEDDLRALMSSAPSPGFEARVRLRIAERAETPHGLAFWVWPLGATCGALALIAVVYLGIPDRGEVTTTLPRVLDAHAAVTYVPFAAAARPERVDTPIAAPPGGVSYGRDVIVNRAETLALQRLFTSPPLVVAQDSPPNTGALPAVPDAIEIPELSIAPLAIEEVKGEPHDR
jgi:hypothetical protein